MPGSDQGRPLAGKRSRPLHCKPARPAGCLVLRTMKGALTSRTGRVGGETRGVACWCIFLTLEAIAVHHGGDVTTQLQQNSGYHAAAALYFSSSLLTLAFMQIKQLHKPTQLL